MNEIDDLKTRVSALEWALASIPMALEIERGFTVTAISQWLYTAADASKRHGMMSDDIHLAVTRLADEMAEINSELPDFLKQLRRDNPRE